MKHVWNCKHENGFKFHGNIRGIDIFRCKDCLIKIEIAPGAKK